MQMGFVGGLTLAGLILLAGLTGVVLVKMTTHQRDFPSYSIPSTTIGKTQQAAISPPVLMSEPALIIDPLTGQSRYARNCSGAIAEAKSIGVLPDYAKSNSTTPRAAGGQAVCSVRTQSALWEVSYRTQCSGGGDTCPVLARVTQEGRFVVFARD